MIDKDDPFVKRVRGDVAEIYRKVRADNPAIARLLFKRSRECEEKLKRAYWGSPIYQKNNFGQLD